MMCSSQKIRANSFVMLLFYIAHRCPQNRVDNTVFFCRSKIQFVSRHTVHHVFQHAVRSTRRSKSAKPLFELPRKIPVVQAGQKTYGLRPFKSETHYCHVSPTGHEGQTHSLYRGSHWSYVTAYRVNNLWQRGFFISVSLHIVLDSWLNMFLFETFVLDSFLIHVYKIHLMFFVFFFSYTRVLIHFLFSPSTEARTQCAISSPVLMN